MDVCSSVHAHDAKVTYRSDGSAIVPFDMAGSDDTEVTPIDLAKAIGFELEPFQRRLLEAVQDGHRAILTPYTGSRRWVMVLVLAARLANGKPITIRSTCATTREALRLEAIALLERLGL